MSARRDWGHARDYVEAMYRILQHDKPDDFVVATGVMTEVRELVRTAFLKAGVQIEYKGKGKEEKGYITGILELPQGSALGKSSIGKCVVEIDPRYFRPAEVDLLIGDPSKIQNELGWKPKYTFDMLIKEMVESDIKLMKRDKTLKDLGHNIMNYYE